VADESARALGATVTGFVGDALDRDATGASVLTESDSPAHDLVDVLIVGAGPTGLTLAAQLQTFDVRFRVVDRTPERAHESRALAVQARTLEILQSLGLGEAMVARGNPSARLALHFEGGRAAEVELGGFAASDTRFPFILFVSQAETEALLGDHLERNGATIERGVELIGSTPKGTFVQCMLRHVGGREEIVQARYLIGCDGAHSTVRKQAGIVFEGDAYLQDFMLGDVDADGPIEADVLHSFAANGHVAMFFPLRSPARWRVIALGPRADRTKQQKHVHETEESLSRGALALDELQIAVNRATSGTIRLRDPVWLTHFRLHHRQARRYRTGRVFLAGDAAHIHSPVGAQGMNTGMQDAWNLGWKVAMVTLGHAEEKLLDTYEAERWPVGRNLLRYTDRIFSLFTRVMSAGALAAWIRRAVVARVLPLIFRSARLRGLIFRLVSELAISYRRCPSVMEGRPKLRSGPHAGDRFPDARIERDGRPMQLQQALSGTAVQLVLCGPLEGWGNASIQDLAARHAGLLTISFLSRVSRQDVLVDKEGEALTMLGLRGPYDAGQYIVRPDGYVAFRCRGRDLRAAELYLERWLRFSNGSGAREMAARTAF
jgi:2-polyprenyl-6-methoxyphenol hydroxylase-like FAD-dependent oxidoreductase